MQPGELDRGQQMTHSYKDDFYSHVSKQFEPQNPKPYQKRKVNGQMKFDDIDDKYAQAISKEKMSYAEKYREHKQENRKWQLKTKTVSDQEIEEFFWDKLVQLGWKLWDDGRSEKGLILQCEECDDMVAAVYYQYMTLDMLRKLESQSLIEKAYQEHKPKCEAISKATPKRSNQ